MFAHSNKEKKDSDKEVVKFISIDKIHPGQTRCSKQNAMDKAKKAMAKKDNMWKHDGKSILSKKKALPVVKSCFGYVLIDGHHDVLASLQLNAKEIPIKIITDLSHLSKDEFWDEAEKQKWAYLYSMDGKKSYPPMKFSELTDDPNRYFATITARKYTSNGNGSFSSKGAEYPLWIKVDKDIPFIEFEIANALYKQNFIYNAEKMGNPPSAEIFEQARKILLESNIRGLRVLSNKTHYQEINVERLIHSQEEAKREISLSIRI